MLSSFRRSAGVALVTLLASCSTQSPSSAPTTNRNVITLAEMLEHQYTTAYDAVLTLRGNCCT